MGLSVVNFTPGIRTNADYTAPDMPNYLSSDEILHSLYQFEKENSHRLNGCIILIHPELILQEKRDSMSDYRR